MSTFMRIRRGIVIAGCVTAVNLAGLAVAGSASAATAHAPGSTASTKAPATGTCKYWWDSNTFGGECTGMSDEWYQAVADCKDGTVQYGTAEGGLTGIWSYAYCAGHGGQTEGYLDFFQP